MPTNITKKMPRGSRCQRLRTSILDAKRQNKSDATEFFRNQQHLRQQPYGVYHNETKQAVAPLFPAEKKQKKKQVEEKAEKQDEKVKLSPVGEIVKSFIVSIPLIASVFAACSNEKVLGILGNKPSDRSGYYALAVAITVMFVGAGIQSIAEKIKSSRKKPKETRDGEAPPTNWTIET